MLRPQAQRPVETALPTRRVKVAPTIRPMRIPRKLAPSAALAAAADMPVAMSTWGPKYTRQNSIAEPKAMRTANIQHAAGRRRDATPDFSRGFDRYATLR